MIAGSDCTNKCIGSIEILSSVVRVVNGKVVNNGLLYCHMLATTIARAYELIQEDTVSGGAPAAAPAAAPEPGCPSDQVITTVVNSPFFPVTTQADLPTTGRSDVSEGTGLFGYLRTPLPSPLPCSWVALPYPVPSSQFQQSAPCQ